MNNAQAKPNRPPVLLGLYIFRAVGQVYTCDEFNNVIWKINTAGVISIFAGNGVLGYTGDGGAATAAELYHPLWLSMDNAGNLYFLDQNAICVRKVDVSGVITTIISSTQTTDETPTGDGGPLSAATFTFIDAFVPDNAGNFYISDYGAGMVRKVNTSGIITTIAGTGVPGFSGDGGLATSAQLKNPYQVSFDNAGNIYIPDAANNRVRKIDAAGIITTVAGNGTVGSSGDGGPAVNAEFYGPWQVVFDNSGNMYIADPGNNRVRKVNAAGIVSDYAGNGAYGYSGDGGPATAAGMTNISGIALDNGGNLYIADQQNYVIRKVNNCLFAQIAQQPAANTICAGGNASFTLTATGSTGYQWQVNTGNGWDNLSDGGVYGGTMTNTLTVTSAVAGMNTTQYQCSVVNGCGTISTVPAILTVNTPSAPTVTIATTADAVCAGSAINFTASATNGGATPAWQWQVNGVNAGTNNATFNSSGLNNGDAVSCVLTSNSTCATIPTAVSNILTMTVNPIVTPVISIAGPVGAICAGSPAGFTAGEANGGATPSWQWQVNGVNAGTNSATYTNSGLNNGDVVTCVLTSDAACATTSTAVSNAVTMTVNPLVTPAISIEGPAGAICAGSPANFTASATNGGATPAWQWQVNGVSAGTNSATYTNSGLNNGDVVSCVLTSNAGCTTAPAAVSNPVTMTVSPQVTPAISIAGPAGTICAGSSASFTASPTNGGAAPAYQWLVNGLPAGVTAATYVDGSLNDGDAINCVMTSDAACLTTPAAISNTIVEQVKTVINAAVSVVASTTTICSGTQVTFTATPVNGGTSPGYQWQVNGGDVGSDKAAFATNDLANGDIVSCVLTSSLSCSTPVASQNQVTMTVNANPTVIMMPDTIIGLGQSVVLLAAVTGPVTSYQWTPAAGLDNPSAPAPVAAPESTTTYQVIVTTDANCTAVGKVTIGVFKTLRMPGAFTPNGDGKNDLFRIPPSLAVKISAFAVYDRWGSRVFYTTNSTAGWDGTLGSQPQPMGTYVWMIEYQDLITGQPAQARGTVILIR
jgi:gliding motility-associated-like protein